MNHATKATAHENKIRRWQTFTPPQDTAQAAHCGLVLHRRAYVTTNDQINGPTISFVPSEAGQTFVSCTVTITDALTSTSQSGSISIAVLNKTDTDIWIDTCKLRNLFRFIPQPIQIGDPFKDRNNPASVRYLAKLEEVIGQIRVETEAIQKTLKDISAREENG